MRPAAMLRPCLAVLILPVAVVAAPVPTPDPTGRWVGQVVFPRTPVVRLIQILPDGTEQPVGFGGRSHRVIADAGDRVRVYANSARPTWVPKSAVLRPAEAARHFAAEAREAAASGVPPAAVAGLHAQWGWAERECGRFPAALAALDAAVALDPDQPVHRLTRVEVLMAAGRTEDAVAACDELVTRQPNAPNTRLYRGWLLMHVGRGTEAVADLSQVIARSDYSGVRLIRASAYEKLGRFADAVADLDAAEKMEPESVSVCNHRAWVLAVAPDAKLRDGRRAVELATKAADATNWQDGTYLDTLAAAYAEVGRYADAAAAQERALADPRFAHRERQEGLERLVLYRQGKPYRAGAGKP